MRQTQVLVEQRDADGLHYRALHLEDDGSLVIEGHDVGGGVEQLWGPGLREYEFERRLDAGAVAQLRRSLAIDAEAPLLEALQTSLVTSASVEQAIADRDIPSTFWSRVGD